MCSEVIVLLLHLYEPLYCDPSNFFYGLILYETNILENMLLILIDFMHLKQNCSFTHKGLRQIY